MTKMDKELKTAVRLLDELYELHGSLAPMVLTLALVIHCQRTGQDPERHVAFGMEWDAIHSAKKLQ
jgi:hypothetical protein